MNDLEKQVLAKVGEDPSAPDAFSGTDIAQIRDSLSDAIQEIITITGGLERTFWLPLRADTAWYKIDLGADSVGWVQDVWMVNNKRRLGMTDLTQLSAYDPRWMKTRANPRAYISVEDLIGFYPIPSSASDTAQITVVTIPAPYTSENERIRLREQFTGAAVHYAVAEYWASRGDAQEAFREGQLYIESLRLRQRYYLNPGKTYTSQVRKEPYPMEVS